jgi:hypothetical protein
VQQCKQAVVDFHNNVFCSLRTSTEIEQCGLRIVRGQTGSCVGETVREAREPIRWTVKTSDSRAGKWQVNDGLYAEVPLWCASGPIARR